MSIVRKVSVLSSDISMSPLYSGNLVMAAANIETWLHMKALEVWRANGSEGSEPEFRGHDPVSINDQRGIEFWGVFPSEDVAKATFEAAVEEKVLLRTAGDYSLSADEVLHELRMNGETLLCGDANSIGVIFNNLRGLNFLPGRSPSWETQTYKDYLDFMAHQLGVSFDGAEIELAIVGMPSMASHQFSQPLFEQEKLALNENQLTVTLNDVARSTSTSHLRGLIKIAFHQTEMPMDVAFDYLHYGAWAERAADNDRPRLALLCSAAWKREHAINAAIWPELDPGCRGITPRELEENTEEILSRYALEWTRLKPEHEPGFYYGVIKANEGEKAMLEGLGVSLGDYHHEGGFFFAEASPEACEKLLQFPADFEPELHFRSDALLSSDTPEEEFTIDQLNAEKAYCEWWLNGPRRREREITKPEKVTDMEVILMQMKDLIGQRLQPDSLCNEIQSDAAPALG